MKQIHPENQIFLLSREIQETEDVFEFQEIKKGISEGTGLATGHWKQDLAVSGQQTQSSSTSMVKNYTKGK